MERFLRWAKKWGGYVEHMVTSTPREYRDAFVDRVRIARVSAGYSVDEMAAILRVRPNTYRRYEGARGLTTPTIMPAHLQPLFCTVCKVSIEWLISGKGEGPAEAPPTRRPRAAT